MKKILNNIGIVFLIITLILALVAGVWFFVVSHRRAEPTMRYPQTEETDPVKRELFELSQEFWTATEMADEVSMRTIADPGCTFVHIGMTCGLDEEIGFYTNGIFRPTEIDIHGQTANLFGDTAIVITDCDYTLDIMGNSTTHHFAVTEVYQQQDDAWKLIQFSFTALVG